MNTKLLKLTGINLALAAITGALGTGDDLNVEKVARSGLLDTLSAILVHYKTAMESDPDSDFHKLYADAVQYVSNIFEDGDFSLSFTQHWPESYLAWMLSAEPKDLYNNGLYHTYIISGTDVLSVYDRNDGLVGFVTGGVVDESIEDSVLIYLLDDGQYEVRVPKAGGYRIEITPTGDGDVDILEEYACGFGVDGSTTFFSLSGEDGITVTSNDVGQATVMQNDTQVEPTYTGSDIRTDIEIGVDTGCPEMVYGAGTYSTGDNVELFAAEDETYGFDGWYLSGELITKNNTRSFFATEDVTYTAAYHEHILAPQYSTEENGIRYTVCSCEVCGETVYQMEEFPKFSIASAALRLTENIDMIYTAEVGAGIEDPYMVFTFNGRSCRVDDYTVDTDGRLRFDFTGIMPQFMGDNISATLYGTYLGQQVSTSIDEYSVRQYCVNAKTKYPDDAALQTLLDDLLTYGAATQTYTGYKTDALVTNGLDLTPSTFTAIEKQKATLIGEKSEIADWSSATIGLSNELAVRFYFTAESTDGLTAEVALGDRTETFDADEFGVSPGGRYFVTLRGIMATEFDEAVTACFKQDGTPIGRTVSYSVNTYISGVQDIADETLRALVRALYNYGASAQAYAEK